MEHQHVPSPEPGQAQPPLGNQTSQQNPHSQLLLLNGMAPSCHPGRGREEAGEGVTQLWLLSLAKGDPCTQPGNTAEQSQRRHHRTGPRTTAAAGPERPGCVCTRM